MKLWIDNLNTKFEVQQHIYKRLQILEHTSSAIFIIQSKTKFQK